MEHTNTENRRLITAHDPQAQDASYYLEFLEDGVYLSLEGGGMLLPELLMFDLERRGLKADRPGEIVIKLRRGESPIFITGASFENQADEDLFIKTGNLDMAAYMFLLPPVKDGKRLKLSEAVERINSKWQITFGINKERVQAALESRQYYKRTEVARGRPPEKGEDGRLTFLFNTEHSYAPSILEDGSADFKNLNIFESVKKGDTVAVCIPPTDGIDGMTVKGKPIPALKGKPAKLPRAKNCIVSEDKMSLIASKSGRIDLINGEVVVSDTYRVSGDVDMSIGNIDFAGDVAVMGNVISGLSIKAEGSIEIMGSVEAAKLYAGKDIVIKNGIQGMDKGVLEAKGSIVSKFLERCTAKAGRNIIADYIVHANISAGEKVLTSGRRSRIIGGTVRAGKSVESRTIGSIAGELTAIEVGRAPVLRARLSKLEPKRVKLKEQITKFENLARIPQGSRNGERAAIREKLMQSLEQLSTELKQTNDEIEDIKQELGIVSDGKVHVTGEIYQNVKIAIDLAVYVTNSMMQYVTFKYKDGSIVFTACEAR